MYSDYKYRAWLVNETVAASQTVISCYSVKEIVGWLRSLDETNVFGNNTILFVNFVALDVYWDNQQPFGGNSIPQLGGNLR